MDDDDRIRASGCATILLAAAFSWAIVLLIGLLVWHLATS